jgi:hypothetical protein
MTIGNAIDSLISIRDTIKDEPFIEKARFEEIITNLQGALSALNDPVRKTANNKLLGSGVILPSKVGMDEKRCWKNVALARIQAVTRYLKSVND